MSIGYNTLYNRRLKRWIDLFLAIILILVLWPCYLIISFAIIIEDGFPIFYRPQRGGYKNRPFRIIKFRSMVKDADKIGGGTTALNDFRITKVGNFLRKTKLDETPQLFNIIAGSMSFIGPRPELLRYVNRYEGEEKIIMEVRPGITDFSSIEFINLDEVVGTGNADEMYEKYVLKKKNELRIEYAKKVSIHTDLILFMQTICHVVKKSLSFIILKKHR